MSAYVVDKKHIDAMIQYALTKAPRYGALAWYTDDETERWGKKRNELSAANADEVGAMLLTENVRSVAHRYAGSPPDELPGRCDNQWMEPYQFHPYRKELTAVAILKAISCYRYQSCEHPGWESSAAYAFCLSLEHAAINYLPGYTDAEWEIRS